MSNETSFAFAYRTAAEELMEAIANPSYRNFRMAQTSATVAQAAAFTSWVRDGLPTAKPGDEWDIATRLSESIVAAANYHGYHTISIDAEVRA